MIFVWTTRYCRKFCTTTQSDPQNNSSTKNKWRPFIGSPSFYRKTTNKMNLRSRKKEKKRPNDDNNNDSSRRRKKPRKSKAASKKEEETEKEEVDVVEENDNDPCLNLLDADSHPHESMEIVARSEELFEKEDYENAAIEATKVLESLPPLPVIAQAALLRGRALLKRGTDAIIANDEQQLSTADLYDKVWNAFGLSSRLNPDCEETMEEMDKISKAMGQLHRIVPPPMEAGEDGATTDFDVVVVGAGAAGIGVALMLTETFGVDKSRVLLVERGEEVGTTFRLWPKEMRFISPSFNQQGWTDSFDLNAIAHGTSPAYSLHSEHPSGNEYAEYLAAIVKTNKLNVRLQTEVTAVRPETLVEEDDKGEDDKEENDDDGSSSDDQQQPTRFLVDVRCATATTTTTTTTTIEEKKEDDTAAAAGAGAATTETLSTRYVVWAAGEFQYPRIPSENNNNEHEREDDGKEGKEGEEEIEGKEEKDEKEGKEEEKETPVEGEEEEDMEEEEEEEEELEDIIFGSNLCLHNSQVRSWGEISGDDFIVIGGYESGIDAAVNLARAGKRCRVLASTPCWNVKTADPSAELAPYTAGRLREVMDPKNSLPKPQLFAPLHVVRVEKVEEESGGGGYKVTAVWGPVEEAENAPLRDLANVVKEETPGEQGKPLVLHTPQPPVLCTGFKGSVAAVAGNLFSFPGKDGNPRKGCLGPDTPLLTEDDESTKTPGVFLVGPSVQHDKLSLCFVYKFRQRFAVVANAICRGLGIDTKGAVATCRQVNMYLDDFARCEDTCGDVC